MTKFLNISTDTSLGNTTPSNLIVSSQKAIKTYVDTALIPTYKIAGRMDFNDLPSVLDEDMIGNVYSVNDPFTSDSRFVVSGKPYAEGTNVVVIQTTEDITYYGYYSSNTGETIYTIVNPYELDNSDTVYKNISDEMVAVGYTDYVDYESGNYSIIYSWIETSSGETQYDEASYNESYNVTYAGTTPIIRYDALGGVDNAPAMNQTNLYVPYRSGTREFSDSSLIYKSSCMGFTNKLHVGSVNPERHVNKGRLTIYDNSPSTNVSSLALLNYGGGGGSGVSIDMYNTSANGDIPSGRFALIDNGNYSGYLQLFVKKSGSQSNPLLPAMNIIPVPAANSLTTCVAFGKDEFHNVLFDLHKPEASCTITDSDKKWGGSGTSYSVTGSNKFNQRLLVAAGDIISFNSFSTEAAVVSVASTDSTCSITTSESLGSVSNANIAVKKAYMKITDENNNIKLLMNPYGKLGLGVSAPAYELDVSGTINASTDVKINGVSVALPTQTGNSGKFLTTNGTAASWATVDALPSQSGQSGKFLTTDGTDASWSTLPTVDQTYDGTSNNAQSGVAVKQAIDADYAMVIVDYTS